MTSVDPAISRQFELFGLIARSLDNLLKLGPTKTTRGAVQSRIASLKANWDKFQVYHDKISSTRTAEMENLAYFSDDLYSTCEEKYLDAHGAMLDLLEARTASAAKTAVAPTPSSTNGSHSRRLPRIEIPKFSGDYAQWSHFRDLFTSMIMENEELPTVEKLHYLKMSLTGEPSQLLKNVAISGDNLTRSWDTLVARYENKRILIDAHLAALFATRKVKNECASDLKKLLADVKEALGALESLDRPVRHWDDLIVFMVVRKLDSESLKDWEKLLGAKTVPPTFEELDSFLVGRIHALEALERSTGLRKQSSTAPASRSPTNARSYSATASEQQCALCNSGHYIASCPKYLERNPGQRREVIIAKNLCFNCLGPHQLKACRTVKRCRICRKQHHSTLHKFANDSNTAASQPSTSVSAATALPGTHSDGISGPSQLGGGTSTSATLSHVAHSGVMRNSPVLLATALVTVRTRSGQRHQLRALLDQGSEASFLSESVAQFLRLSRKPATVPILGIGAQRSSVSNGRVSLEIIARTDSTFSLVIDALVLPKLTAYLPPAHLEHTQWPHINGLPLADPTFATPGKIDLVLGASVYAQVLEDGLRRGPLGSPLAQKTSFGWILSGPLSNESEHITLTEGSVHGLQCTLDHELLEMLQRFWAQEEVPSTPSVVLTTEESQCEEHFKKTHTRDVQGRFVVRLPLKTPLRDLGDSRTPALNMLKRLEKRFETCAPLKFAYLEFLREYRELDHMRLVNAGESSAREFCLPHHGVIKDSSSTTKLRVVFNGSQKTNTGISLNDCLHIGPKLQTDLTDVITRWRRHQYVFAADIEKMYRQIRVHPDDWSLQKIFWRDSPNENIREYELCTVTYGLACAPYLALRCVQQLAEETPHDVVAELLRHDTYVDDILSGADQISTARAKIHQLRDTLTAGGFLLKKWLANSPELLEDVPCRDQATFTTLPVGDLSTHCALGILWNRNTDCFVFSAPSISQPHLKITKRVVLSFIARIFDPLGWIAPITITAKMLLQELWAIRLDWDEELSDALKARWTDYTQPFEQVSNLVIPRWFGTHSDDSAVDLHGFSDASQAALAAVIYLRVVTPVGIRVTLVCAKTKVTPLKRLTIPRLELSAAVLLVKQVRKIRETLTLTQTPIHLWTDSSVALSWIKSHPSRWKEFVRNRVSFIQELSHARWRHISGKENPADLATRGISPHRLQHEQLWWTGPSWLQGDPTEWPSSTIRSDSTLSLDERARTCAISIVSPGPELWDIIHRYSALTSLVRITAWIRRAIGRFRRSKNVTSRVPLSADELESSLKFWVTSTQQAYFATEFRLLRTHTQLPKSSPLYRLMPFLDTEGFIRLRGRLQFSQLDPNEKHPLIMPRSARLTELIIDYHHRRTLHGGPQLTLASIRRKFWILGGRLPIRSLIRRCVTCTRHRAVTGQQRMGQLPPSRVIPCRPFYHAGVDYAGPLSLKTFRGRGAKIYKGYFVIFVCFTTSAVHLEVATDYSAEGFIAAYKRFSGRRGLCSTLTSDCGTNLVGADAELQRLFKASTKERDHIAAHLANDGVTWKFNPPSAPHFGGKWEAGVKSVKFHLRRVIGETLLTYEEMTTLLIQIEAVLNSRPLSALSDDPSDIAALTPGHFLVGSALTTVPEPSLQDIPDNRLSRWQLLRRMTETFWKRWSTEYLSKFQVASKWHRAQDVFQVGTLVLVKDERMPPTKWLLARIVAIHPGPDGLVRVATVKTATSILKRPIVKLCALPAAVD